jgi:hypothetical protein
MIIKGIQLKGVTVRDRVSVVQSNLAYYIDAGNSASYSGTGSSMTNISSVSLPVSTLVGSPTYNSLGEASYFSFNGTNQYVITGNMIGQFNIPINNNLTLETWVRTSSDNGVISTEQGTAASGTTINQGFHDAQQNIVSGFLYQGVWDGFDNTGPNCGAVTRNVWQQYVMTYNSATSTVTGYIDGVLEATEAPVTRISPQSDGRTSYFYGIMAADPQSFGDGTALAGDWSIFRAYTRVLSDAEVLQNYLATYPRYYA